MNDYTRYAKKSYYRLDFHLSTGSGRQTLLDEADAGAALLARIRGGPTGMDCKTLKGLQLTPNEGQEIWVDHVRMCCKHAVGIARKNLERAVFYQLGL
jgi:hypothetical protein